jgi:hypothetical protein
VSRGLGESQTQPRAQNNKITATTYDETNGSSYAADLLARNPVPSATGACFGHKRGNFQDADPSLWRETIQGLTRTAAGRCCECRYEFRQRSCMWTVRSRANSSGTELPQSPEEQSPVGSHLPRHALSQSMKRSLHATSDIDPLPAKRARLTQRDGQQAGVGKEQAAEVWQPSPTQAND